jgi:hypothetical protein
MKKHLIFQCRMLTLARLGLLGGLGLFMGCDSPSSSSSSSSSQTTESKPPPAAQTQPAQTAPLPAGVLLHSDGDIQGVWLAEGFDFKGYGTLYVMAPVFAAVERSNETDMRAMAMKVLPDELATRLRDTRVFNTVTVPAANEKPGSRSLRLESTITEYEQGGSTARLFAGVFGGGQPVIRVRGQLFIGEKLLWVFDIRRSGASAEARTVGHSMSNEEVQRGDIRDLSIALADFVKRTAKVP